MTNSAADLRVNESVNAYAPGTAEHRAATFLTGKGQNATPAAVAGLVRDLRERDEARARHGPQNAKWRAEALTQGQRVAGIIARARRRYGTAPAWAVLSRFLGWSRLEGQVKLNALKAAGFITFTHERRSLDVGRLYVEKRGPERPRPSRVTAKGPPR